MHRSLALALTLSFVLAAPALAKDAAFVAPSVSKALLILPPPPAPDSDVAKAELLELHRIETTRTPAEADQAKLDGENENIFLFRTVFGEGFTPEKLPGLSAFGKRVKGDEGLNTAPAKDGFLRVRPYNADKTLKPVCKTTTKDNSYPSGHATSGYLLALTLIDMVPEQRDAILARADGYARSRLVCGVHYPSDLVAGRLMGYTIHAIMAANPDYLRELAPARTELRQALGLSAAN